MRAPPSSMPPAATADPEFETPRRAHSWAIILAKWVFHGYSDWLIGGPPDPRGQPRVPITITTTASFGAAQQSTDLPLPPRDLRVLPIRLVLPSLFLGPARLKAS